MNKNTPTDQCQKADYIAADTAKSKEKRRALLRAISAAGVAGALKLPEKWGRPVVDHAVLPVHAEGSPAVAFGCAVTCIVERTTSVAIIRDPGAGASTLGITVGYSATVGLSCMRTPDGSTAAGISTGQLNAGYVSTDELHSFFYTFFGTVPPSDASQTTASGTEGTTTSIGFTTDSPLCTENLSAEIQTVLPGLTEPGPFNPFGPSAM